MAIVNNSTFVTKPVNIQALSKSASQKNVASENVNEVPPIAEKAGASEPFSMVLSEKQKDSLYESLGYDQPSSKQIGAVNAYMQVAAQEKRESIMDSMGFHFVV